MKRSKKKNSVKYLIASTIIVIGIFILFQELRSKPTKNEEEIIAKVNGEPVLKSELEKKIKNFVNMGFDQIEIPQIESMPKEVLEVIIKDIYFERNVVKEAVKLGLDKNLEINEKLQEYKKKLLTQEYLKVSTEKEISDEAVNNKYIELTNKLEGKKEYRISHILVKNKENIEPIYKKLTGKKPENFEKLAKENSIDKQSASNGGDMGFVIESSLIKEIKESLPNLKKNEISKPIKSNIGWHIVKVVEIRDAKALPFENVKEKIREQLKREKITEIARKISENVVLEFVINFPESSENKTNDNQQLNNNEDNKDQSSQEKVIKVNLKSDENQKSDNKKTIEPKSDQKNKSNDKSKTDQNKKNT